MGGNQGGLDHICMLNPETTAETWLQDDGKDEELGKAVMPYDEVAQGETVFMDGSRNNRVFLCPVFVVDFVK